MGLFMSGNVNFWQDMLYLNVFKFELRALESESVKSIRSKNFITYIYQTRIFTYKIRNFTHSHLCGPSPPVHQQLGHDYQDTDQHGQPHDDEGPPEDREAVRLRLNLLRNLSLRRIWPMLTKGAGYCFRSFKFRFRYFIGYMAALPILKF